MAVGVGTFAIASEHEAMGVWQMPHDDPGTEMLTIGHNLSISIASWSHSQGGEVASYDTLAFDCLCLLILSEISDKISIHPLSSLERLQVKDC